ncbi:MAG: HAD-IA family hydrolase [Acetobacteraceae bacterium]|nr:HAD-IA family hydrolase [Acetobacteraceae bacterium]
MTERPLFPERRFAALVFDMDGTILTSIAAAERVWTKWATRHGVDVAAFLPTIHGVQAVDTISRLGLPGVDPAAEADEITREEIVDVAGIDPIPGAPAFLSSLPAGRWGVVTSATLPLAKARLQAAGLPLPAMLITAEEVTRGKPAPDGYLLAAERLGCRAADLCVFEDAAAGIQSAEAAGAAVAVITATHRHKVETPHPVLASYAGLIARLDHAGLLQLVRRSD